MRRRLIAAGVALVALFATLAALVLARGPAPVPTADTRSADGSSKAPATSSMAAASRGNDAS